MAPPARKWPFGGGGNSWLRCHANSVVTAMYDARRSVAASPSHARRMFGVAPRHCLRAHYVAVNIAQRV